MDSICKPKFESGTTIYLEPYNLHLTITAKKLYGKSYCYLLDGVCTAFPKYKLVFFMTELEVELLTLMEILP